MRLRHELYIPRTEMRAWLPVLGWSFDLAVYSLMSAECAGHIISPDCMPHMQAWRRRSMGAVVPKARRVCMDRVWTRGMRRSIALSAEVCRGSRSSITLGC
jgi:hypothetical protein